MNMRIGCFNCCWRYETPDGPDECHLLPTATPITNRDYCCAFHKCNQDWHGHWDADKWIPPKEKL